MDVLEPGQLNRLLRDLELTAPVAIRRALPQAQLHLWLLMRVRNTDVRADEAFQQRLVRHIGLRGKLRACKPAVFGLLQEMKSQDRPGFEEMLRRVSGLTGQVEKSVASALLGLLDPDQPSIDRDLRELLPRYGFPTLAEAPAFDECVVWHRRLHVLFAQVIGSPRWPSVSSGLDGGLGIAGGAVLSEVRKLNLQLSHSRRAVALMPTIELVPSSRPGRGGAAAAGRGDTPSAPTAQVRLHLCR